MPKALASIGKINNTDSVGIRRLMVLAGLIAIGLCGTAWLLLRGPEEPVCQGKSLSVWLHQLSPYAPTLTVLSYSASTQEAGAAIRQIGTNALPHLLRLMSYRDSALKRRIIAFHNKYSPIRFNVERADVKHALALGGLRVLGAEAKPAIPALVNLLHGNSSSQGVSYYEGLLLEALSGIGNDSIPALRGLLRNGNRDMRMKVAFILSMLNPDQETVDDLVSLLKDKDPEVRKVVTYTFVILRNGAALASLIENLQDTDPEIRKAAIIALGYYGKQAELALPALHQAALDSDPAVRSSAADTIKKIKDMATAN